MFSSRLSLSVLIELCRVLRHYLGAGLALPDVFRQQEKRGPAAVRPVAGRIARVLEDGDSLEDALKPETPYFPPLFISLASVGERTGNLPEVFAELERFYLRQQQLKRSFLARITWPVTQFVLAVFVLALVIFIMGQLSPVTPGGKPFDPVGLGLFGASGALTFIVAVFGSIAALFGLYWFVSRTFGGRVKTHRLLLNVPALGPCLQALALGRFCLALQLTTEAGMSIRKALRLSLRATSNAAFEDAAPRVEEVIEGGDDVTLALQSTGLFPEEFERILAVAEESGTLAEVMKHQGDHYADEASRRLAALTSVAGYGVYALTGLFIVIFIFRMYGRYLNLLSV
jgi:type IV pilus assembly protein PilC